MIKTSISGDLLGRCPDLHLGLVQCEVTNTESNDRLWRDIWRLSDHMRANMPMNQVKLHPPIEATRLGYKACRKDPNRYRPSAEALRRRIIKDQGLFKVNTLVDIINFVSLRTGYSINGFDADKIVGDLEWDIGKRGEPFEAIGRGKLNIKGLPVVRDEEGPIGSPTSDSVRTAITMETTRLYVTMSSFGGHLGLERSLEDMVEILVLYGAAHHVQALAMGPQL